MVPTECAQESFFSQESARCNRLLVTLDNCGEINGVKTAIGRNMRETKSFGYNLQLICRLFSCKVNWSLVPFCELVFLKWHL